MGLFLGRARGASLAGPLARGAGCGQAMCLEGVRPHDDGEPQQGAGAVVHGHVLGDHLQVHHVLAGPAQGLGHHQHGAHVAGALGGEWGSGWRAGGREEGWMDG